MKRLKEKIKCIWHIIKDREYAVFTGTSKNKRASSCCAIISDNATIEFKEAAIEVLNNNGVNYYFVSYAHKGGFGRAHIDFEGELSIRQLEIEIMESKQKKEVIILHYQKISKEQYLGGFI